jgi:23S rRNA (adenine2503-C2)-methyltransferase
MDVPVPATPQPALTALPALTDLEGEAWAALSGVPGARSFTARVVRRWIWEKGARDFEAMSDLPRPLRNALAQRFAVRHGRLEQVHEAADGTLGLLTRLHDGQVLESVCIPEADRNTLCLSSQVGCAVRCRFCASGLDGLLRNLSAGEILEQVLVAREARPDQPLTNYVFMGSGEPTHNLKAVTQALRVMTSPEGLGIGARRITVSTVGHPEAVRRLAEIELPFNLALSVHMPSDAGREALMPGLGSSDLAATLAAAQVRFEASGRRVTVEVVVLAGVNDREQDARDFARLLRGLPVAVNLIPWNPVDGLSLTTPSPDRVRALAATLNRQGVTATIRRPRGQDVGVACGQLRRRVTA